MNIDSFLSYIGKFVEIQDPKTTKLSPHNQGPRRGVYRVGCSIPIDYAESSETKWNPATLDIIYLTPMPLGEWLLDHCVLTLAGGFQIILTSCSRIRLPSIKTISEYKIKKLNE